MKLKLCLLGLCLLAFPVMYMNAQVTVGSNSSPTDESAILRIDGDKTGLRLPRLTVLEREALLLAPADKSNPLAKGLTIYNVENQKIEFWNGTSWSAIDPSITVANGLTLKDNKTIQLGGTLTDATTTINQAGNALNFTTGAGTYSINNDVFSVNKDNVTSNTVTDYAINTDAFKIASSNQITANVGTAGLYVNDDVLTVVNDGTTNVTTINTTSSATPGKLTYNDGTQQKGYILASKDANGLAEWQELKAAVTTEKFTINPTYDPAINYGTVIAQSATADVYVPLTNDITLGEGQWLIVGKCTTYTSSTTTTATSNKYTYLRLIDSNSNVLYTTAIMPERKIWGGAEPGGAYAVPQATYLLNVPAGGSATVRLEISSRKGSTFLTNTFGKAYFEAINLFKKN